MADRRDEEPEELRARGSLRDEELGEEELALADDFDSDDGFALLAGGASSRDDSRRGGSAPAGIASRIPSKATGHQPARRYGDS